jgi:hypothetical protein
VSTLDPRRVLWAFAAVVAVFVAGTIGYRGDLDESWITVMLVLAGIAIFAYVAAVAVEAIASGVLGEAWKEKRRRRMIDELHDHVILRLPLVSKRGGTLDTRPSNDTVLDTGDVIVGVGAPDEIRALEALFPPREPVAG